MIHFCLFYRLGNKWPGCPSNSHSPVGHWFLAGGGEWICWISPQLLQEISGSRPSRSLRVIRRMKVDIHNHILPKEWPDLKQVGNERHKLIKSLWWSCSSLDARVNPHNLYAQTHFVWFTGFKKHICLCVISVACSLFLDLILLNASKISCTDFFYWNDSKEFNSLLHISVLSMGG